jgi:hypothetical protein
MPDMPSFKVVPPSNRIDPDFVFKSKLPDGTPMVGPNGLLVPPGRSFSMIVNAATKIFSYRFDEAMRDNFVNARAMRRDAFLRGLFEERILPTINREWTLDVDDDQDPEQAYVRDQLTKVIKSTQDFDAFKRANLDGVWFGRAGCQWAYGKRKEADDQWGLSKWDPLHGDSVQFTYEGTPAILLDAMSTGWYASHGANYGTNGDLRPTDRGGTALVLQRPYWRDRFSIHVHMREKADYFEGELAGSVQGLGLRGLVYWQYVVRTDALTWMLAYMQAVGQMDLLVFNYPAGNADAKAQQELNAQKIIGKAAIACPRNPTGNWPAIEQIQMNAAGLKALQELVADYFDRHIERLFVGQSMSSGADKGDGLGGTGRSEFAKATKDEILVYDTGRLDNTFTSDLVAPLKRYNFPWAKFPVRFKSIIPNLKAEEKVQSGLAIAAAGVKIKMDEVREAAGYSRPEDGDETIGGPPPGMPGDPAMGGAPPMSMPPGSGPPGGGAGGPPPMQWQPGPAALQSAAMAPPPGAGGGGPPGPPGPAQFALFQSPARMGPPVRLADTPPVSGPVMGYPGGSNTYKPTFGPPKFGDKRKWHQGKPLQDLIGFTRYYSTNVPLEYQAGPHKFASTHVRLTGEAAIRLLQMAGAVRDEDLADDGRETEPHVTLLYGLHGNNPVPVGNILKGTGPVMLHLGKISHFPGGDGKDYDVLKCDVESRDLLWLNRKLRKLPSTETFKYAPHATIAYVKKGLGEKYAKLFAPLDIEVEANGVIFSDQEHNQTMLPLVAGGEEVHPPIEYRQPVMYKVAHAPVGGVTIQGKQFRGGQFIPAEVMAQASPQERAAVEGGSSRGKPLPPPGGAKLAEPPQQPQSAPPAPAPPPGEPIIQSPGLSPADARLEVETQLFVRQNYPALRDAYLAKNGSVDAATGEVKSVSLNTDEWRELIPGYTGTNASPIHEAASWCNKQMLEEALVNMRNKGNNKFMVLAGGGGSGKGTATGEYFTQAEFPIILDQVSDRMDKLIGKLGQAQANGFQPTYVFIDRPPEGAAGGIVGRALQQRQEGQIARTVNIDVGIKANIDSRITALNILRSSPDIEASVIDNRGGRFKRRLITDRSEGIQYLEERIAEDLKAVEGGKLNQKIRENILARHEAGEIPEDLVTGFLGPGWKPPVNELAVKLAAMKTTMAERNERVSGAMGRSGPAAPGYGPGSFPPSR